MISFDEAVELIRAAAHPIGTESVSVESSTGRVLAAPVIACIASPRSDVSGMDGYAVRDTDVASPPARLRLVGKSFAGAGWTGTVRSGECARIFTGAPLPLGADRVVIQENVRREDDFAIIDERPGSARHIRMRGSDFREGDVLLLAGRLLDKRAIVTAAAADVDRIEVFTRPRVSILSTGDELAEPGLAAGRPDAIPESVSFGVAALAAEWGAIVTRRQRLRDELPSMEKAAANAVGAADVVVVTGGASVGERDFAKSMFEPVGLQLIFSKVSIKPGKPVWLARSGNALVMGLPGNPTSALVTARLLLAPLLASLGGRNAADVLCWRLARLASQLGPCGARETFHRGRWRDDGVEILGFQDSSAQRALADAELLVRQPANGSTIAVGETVHVIEF